MGTLTDLQAKVKKYYKYTPHEIRTIILTIIVFSFIISFKNWGDAEFSFGTGMFNWFNAALIVTLGIIVSTSAQRIAGLSVGFRVEYKMWATGLLLSILAVFLTRGNFWILLPGSIMLHHLAGHRLGYFRYGLGYFAHGMIATAGPIALITLAAIFKAFNTYLDSSLLEKAILFFIAFAIYDMLPIPPLSGSQLYFGSRMVYAFLFSTIVAAGLLLLYINALIAILVSLIIGVVCWLVYYIFFEEKYWRGPWPK